MKWRGWGEETPSESGKDAFHRVPFFSGEVRDAVERLLTNHFAKATAFLVALPANVPASSLTSGGLGTSFNVR
jgi:hypothetical protein